MIDKLAYQSLSGLYDLQKGLTIIRDLQTKRTGVPAR
jgi:hypothetical protein